MHRGADVVQDAGDSQLFGPRAATDGVLRLQHGDVETCASERDRGGEPVRPGAHHRRTCHPGTGLRGCRPGRTPGPGWCAAGTGGRANRNTVSEAAHTTPAGLLMPVGALSRRRVRAWCHGTGRGEYGPRGTDRPPARYRELGNGCPTARSVTRAASTTAASSMPVTIPASSVQ